MKKLFIIVLMLIVSQVLFADTNMIFKPNVPGAIYYVKDNLDANISLITDENIDKSVLEFKYFDPYGNELLNSLKEIVILKSENWSKNIELPFFNGHVKVYVTINNYFNDVIVSTSNSLFNYAIIPDNYQDFKDVNSPFGVNCHFNQGWDPFIGKIVKRVGIEYVRDGEASTNDLSYPVCVENKLCYMPCFTGIATPTWEYLEKEISNGKKYNEIWDFKDYINDYATFAKQYGDYVDYYDIANEPMNVPAWMKFNGSWYGGEWTNVFLQWGTQVAKNIRKYDKSAQIVWEDCGPQLWIRQFVKQGLNEKYIDAISPHPYNLHRNLNLPEDTETIEDYALTALWLKENKFKSLPFIIGELGVSSFSKNENYGPNGFYTATTELEQAQQITRHLATAFARGVKKFFYYDFKNDFIDPYNPEANFGLINYDLTPKPSVVAYANFISRTRGCEWLGRYTCGAGCYAYAFKQPNADTASIILWSKNGEKLTQLFHCDQCPDVLDTYDIFGNKVETIKKESNNIFNIVAKETPVYIDDIPIEDLKYTVYKHDYLK